MTDKEDRLTLSAAAQTYDQIAFVGHGAEYFDVRLGKSGFAETRCHGFSRGGHVSFRRIGRIDLDQFFQNVTRKLLCGSKIRRKLLSWNGGCEHQQAREEDIFYVVHESAGSFC